MHFQCAFQKKSFTFDSWLFHRLCKWRIRTLMFNVQCLCCSVVFCDLVFFQRTVFLWSHQVTLKYLHLVQFILILIMVALSKYYSEIMKSNNVTCAHVLHPNTSCTYFLLETLPITLFRTAQFFVPLYFVSVKQQWKNIYKKAKMSWIQSHKCSHIELLQLPMIANSKNLTREKLYESLEVFVSSVITGGATVYIAYLMICTLS